MAGPAHAEFSENRYQGYWELETNYPINGPIYIPDPNGKIINAIYDAANNKKSIGVYRRPPSPGAECRGCNISGGKNRKQKSKRHNKNSKKNKNKKCKTTKKRM